LLSLVGCGATLAAQPKPVVYHGDAAGEPQVSGLPSLDVPDSELTSEMRIARLLCEESLHVPDPALPEKRDAASIQLWSETVFARWVEDKTRRASVAKSELDRAAEQSHRQRIVAGALVGLLYEDLAQVMLAVPVPEDFASEPEVAQMFREVMNKQALPYLTEAQRAYDACSGNATQDPSLKHWSHYCKARSEGLALVGRPAESAVESGQTEVVVIAP
jgi:hypothetical protein